MNKRARERGEGGRRSKEKYGKITKEKENLFSAQWAAILIYVCLFLHCVGVGFINHIQSHYHKHNDRTPIFVHRYIFLYAGLLSSSLQFNCFGFWIIHCQFLINLKFAFLRIYIWYARNCTLTFMHESNISGIQFYLHFTTMEFMSVR